MTVSVPRDAATVVLLRDGESGLETCLLQRSPQLDFAPGAHVFPGGALEQSDGMAPVAGIPDEEASALAGVEEGGLSFWAAAVRECFEEAGVLPALSPAPPAPGLGDLRTCLNDGLIDMVGLLGHLGAVVDAGRLRCIARWVTPPDSLRRYDTRFFVAAMPSDQHVDVDGREVVAHRWVTPSEALGLHRRDEIELVFPTARTLARLEAYATVREAMERLAPFDTTTALTTEPFAHGERELLVLHGDPEGNGGVYDSRTADPVHLDRGASAVVERLRARWSAG